MKNRPRLLRFVRILILAAVLTALSSLAAALFLRRLGDAVRLIGRLAAPDEPLIGTLSEVFGALRNASILPSIPASAVFCVPAALLAVPTGKKAGKSGRALVRSAAVIGCVFLFFMAFAAAAWFASVNSIRFGDVLTSLIRTITSGALDSLDAASGMRKGILL